MKDPRELPYVKGVKQTTVKMNKDEEVVITKFGYSVAFSLQPTTKSKDNE
jgi:hypothetical protein